MVPAFDRAEPRERVPLAVLFAEFLRASLTGFGGGPVWIYHAVVERRGWIGAGEFADILSLCQFMPGPNAIGIAVCVGEKLRGGAGALAAMAGFLVLPGSVGFAIAMLFLQHIDLPLLGNLLAGIAPSAAGLLIAAGLKLLLPHRRRPMAVLFAGAAFGLIAFAKLPLLLVLFGLAPLGIAVAALTRGPAV